MTFDRFIAVAGAIAWAYAAVASIVFNHFWLAGPCAAGFVICLFVAQLLEPRAPFDGQGE